MQTNKKEIEKKIIEKAKDLIKNPGKYKKATSYGAAGYIDNISFDENTGEIINTALLSLTKKKLKKMLNTMDIMQL